MFIRVRNKETKMIWRFQHIHNSIEEKCISKTFLKREIKISKNFGLACREVKTAFPGRI
jgi:hypothetical protein